MIENDYELIHSAQEGNEDAINYIYKKYKPIIIKKSNNAIIKATNLGIEINDIMQECYIALKEAIDSFKEQDETTFYTFANLCIDRQILSYIKRLKAGKGRILNEAIFIDENLENILTTSIDTEDEMIINEQEENIIERIMQELSQSEIEVFKLKLKGYSYEEISKKLNKDHKAIYNSFQRIKSKIKKIIEKNI